MTGSTMSEQPVTFTGGGRTAGSPPTVQDPGRAGTWSVAQGVGIVWAGTLAAALFSPSLVTGSLHERLPLAGVLDWIWAAVATAYVLAAAPAVRRAPRDVRVPFVAGLAVVWVCAALASIFTQSLVTGTDPTRIPVAALLAPLVAMAVTGMICIFAVRERSDEPVGGTTASIGSSR